MIPISAADAASISLLLASLGLAVTLLEDLTVFHLFESNGVLSWEVARSRLPWTVTGRRAMLLNGLLRPDRYRFLMMLALAAAIAMPLVLRWPGLQALLTGTILLHLVLTNVRNIYGSDGSDQMFLVLFAALFLSSFVPSESLAFQACLWFIAVQVALSYFISGVAKLISPEWRSGRALVGILGTTSYGNHTVHRLLLRYSVLALLGCWAVIGFETLFPLLFLPLPTLTLIILAISFAFHVANALIMGLNNFFWAFVATYPIVWYCASQLAGAY